MDSAEFRELAREGLKHRLRRTEVRRWRLDHAMHELEKMEEKNESAIAELGNPLIEEREARENARREKLKLIQVVERF